MNWLTLAPRQSLSLCTPLEDKNLPLAEPCFSNKNLPSAEPCFSNKKFSSGINYLCFLFFLNFRPTDRLRLLGWLREERGSE